MGEVSSGLWTVIRKLWALKRGLDTLGVGRRRGWSQKLLVMWDGEKWRQVQMCVFCPGLPALPAQLLATLLIQYERLQGVQSSGVLIIFWFLCVVCDIIPFRSKILSAKAEVRSGRGEPARFSPDRRVTSAFKVTAGSQVPPGGFKYKHNCVVLHLPHFYLEAG